MRIEMGGDVGLGRLLDFVNLLPEYSESGCTESEYSESGSAECAGFSGIDRIERTA